MFCLQELDILVFTVIKNLFKNILNRFYHQILMNFKNKKPQRKEMILKNLSVDEIEKAAKKEGMMTMIEDGIFLAAQGITSTEEVLRVVSE